MLEHIVDIREQLLSRIMKDMGERGVDRIDTTEMGKLVDMVKDLSKAGYYCAVTEAMEPAGYRMGYQPRMRMGYDTYGRRGYDIEAVRQSMMTAGPEERERMRAELRSLMEM